MRHETGVARRQRATGAGLAESFWTSPPAADAACDSKTLGHQQVNDAYLVEVAHRSKGRLITFDQRLQIHAGTRALVHVLSPA